MITLDQTTKSLEILLSGAVTTAGLQWGVSYREIGSTGLTCSPKSNQGYVSGTTVVPMVSGFGANTCPEIDSISVYNNDSVAARPTVRIFNSGGFIATQAQCTLNTGEGLYYDGQEEGGGWYALDTGGARKQTYNFGVGTSGFIAKWATTGQLGTSLISDDGTNLNIKSNASGVVLINPGLSGGSVRIGTSGLNSQGGPSYSAVLIGGGQSVSGSAGAQTSITAGLGGASTLGGYLSVVAGSGGLSAAAGVTAGAGGSLEVLGGVGGNSSGFAATTGGAGGSILIQGGQGGSARSGYFGAGGTVIINAGQGGNFEGIAGELILTNTGSGVTSIGNADSLTTISGRLIAPSGFANIFNLASGTVPFPGYVQGFKLRWVSSGSIEITSGVAADKSGTALIGLNNTIYLTVSGTLPFATVGGSGRAGMDIVNINNCRWATGNTIVSGIKPLSELWPVRTCTGNCFLSGTTVAGLSGTRFCEEISINDMVGRSGTGFWRVTAVNSGVLTVALSGALISGVTQVIENATIAQSGRLSRRVNRISSGQNNGSIHLESAPDVSGINIPGFIGTYPNTYSNMNVWIAKGQSGVQPFLSTQRTNPLVSGMVGYTDAYRRVGSVIMCSGLSIYPFQQAGLNQERMVILDSTSATLSPISNLVAAGNAATWTDVVASPLIPPTSDVMIIFHGTNPATTQGTFIRTRNVDPAATGGGSFEFSSQGTGFQYLGGVQIDCDSAQGIQYISPAAGGNVVIRVIGYKETL